MTQHHHGEDNCCPEFNPSLWNNKIIHWDKKQFITSKVKTFLFIPLNFGKVMTKLDSLATKHNAITPEAMCLSEHTSKWSLTLHLAVTKEIPGIENTTLSGNFYSKVFEGNFKDTGKWTQNFEKEVLSQGYKLKRTFMWYTTCPECAKKYGKNYVVIIGEI